MADHRVLEQVLGILGLEGVGYSLSPDKTGVLVPVGSAGVYISLRDWGESTIVYIRATILGEIEKSDDRLQKVYPLLNETNWRSSFAKLYYNADESSIVLEYDLLGDRLDSVELMNALHVIASMADDLDDKFSTEIGSGLSAKAIWDRDNSQAQGPDTGPVVNA
jgi:hypothetical protein